MLPEALAALAAAAGATGAAAVSGTPAVGVSAASLPTMSVPRAGV
jgi:hypothetical protein